MARIDLSKLVTAEQKAAQAATATVDGFRLAIQKHVDETAQARRYDSGNSLASYVASTNDAWAAEAQAFVAWRDAVWVHAYAELDKVMAGERTVPEVADLMAELPAIDWPAV